MRLEVLVSRDAGDRVTNICRRGCLRPTTVKLRESIVAVLVGA
jgi:hypothetical protein